MTDNSPEKPSDVPSDLPSDAPSDLPSDVPGALADDLTDEPTPYVATPSPAPWAGHVPPPAPGYAPPPAPGYAPPPAGGYAPPPAPGYGGPQGYPPPYAPGTILTPSDQRTWAVVSHLGTLIASILAPLIIWLVFKGRGAFLEDQAKESLNFQITATIAAIVLSIVSVITFGIGFLLFLPFGLAWLVFIIIAAVQSGQGVLYRYPLTYRFIK